MTYDSLGPLTACWAKAWDCNKAFREQQHPSAPGSDQWMNSPFIGQQVRNCKSFTLTHYLADIFVNPIVHPTSYPTHIPFIPSESNLPFLSYSNFNILPQKSKVKVMGEVKVWSHNVSLTFYWLASLPFHVNLPSHSWDKTFKIWPGKSKVKVMEEVNIESHNMSSTFYLLTSLSFHVNRPSHSWDTAFQNLTLKIQHQGHGWDGHWKSQHGSNILSTHIPLIPNQSAIPFLRYDFFKIWPWKSKVKVMGEGNVESH